MWARAAWVEGNQEEEGVIPLCWISQEKKSVRWPPKNESKAMKAMWHPESHWWEFPLIKMKIASGTWWERLKERGGC